MSVIKIISDYIFFLPLINEMTNRMIKMTNNIFAILAAPAAIPPKPKTPAIIAKIIKVTVQRNIEGVFSGSCILKRM